MLRTRVITAIVLLAVILPVLFVGSRWAIQLLCTVFFAAACWESCRLFRVRFVILSTVIWTALYGWLVFFMDPINGLIWFIACLIWIFIFIPLLKFGLPDFNSYTNRLLSVLYLISILACFLVIPDFLFEPSRSPFYLLSVMAIVWVADIGAYFFGKAFGRHKLAPLISPGKSWEGAIGGWICVLAFGIAMTYFSFKFYSSMPNNFFLDLFYKWGWVGLGLVLSLLTAASVVGDLVESQLKRRAQMKDSSQLLPGHGGVLDRIDALIFVLPLALMIDVIMNSCGH